MPSTAFSINTATENTLMPAPANEHPATDAKEAWLPIVVEKLRGLRFGVVQIVVHDSQVVQIERTERTRLDRQGDGPPRIRKET